MSNSAAGLSELLLICIHGFKGCDNTFENFPDRLGYTLSHTFNEKIKVERIVYPRYRTAGELSEAVTNFLSWLVTLVGNKESEGSGKGTVGVILLGHSMGGLVCADSVLGLAKAYELGKAPLWPRILGIIAYDTPYLGVNPGTFKAGIEQAIDYGTQAYGVASAIGAGVGYFTAKKNASQSNTRAALPPAPSRSAAANSPEASAAAASTSRSSSWLVKAGAVAGGSVAAAAAGAALWMNRQALSQFATLGWSETQDHLTFVKELWKPDELAKRLEAIVELDDEGKKGQEKPGTGLMNRVGFHCFYTLLHSTKDRPRTFVVLPAPAKKQLLAHFTANENSRATTETDAHVSMFNVKSDGNHDLAMRSTQLITDWISAQPTRAQTFDPSTLDG